MRCSAIGSDARNPIKVPAISPGGYHTMPFNNAIVLRSQGLANSGLRSLLDRTIGDLDKMSN